MGIMALALIGYIIAVLWENGVLQFMIVAIIIFGILIGVAACQKFFAG